MAAHQAPSEAPQARPDSAAGESVAAPDSNTSRWILDAPRPECPRVVIAGAGFGGLEAARTLAHAPVEIVVVDQHNYHCFQPLLYQVATAALSPADIAWPIRSILRRQRNARVVMARVAGIDKDRKLVITDSGLLPYDFLILATGATNSYFGHGEWESAAPGLKGIADATKIRARILRSFEEAELAVDEQERQCLTTFVVIGGGPTGVEMAGAIAEVAGQTLRSDFHRIDPRTARIMLIEAGPRLLAAFPDNLSRYASNSLTRMGVEVKTSTRVTACDAHGVRIGNERIDAATLIWAAGVTASPAAAWLGAPHDHHGRILVNSDLTVSGIPNIFAIGDTATIKDPKSGPVPGIAPAAKQMGRYAGKRITAQLIGRPMPEPFVYRDLGDLATIGRNSAVVKVWGIELTGFIGWLFWSMVHIYFLIGTRDRLVVAVNWFWNYLTFQRGARLIT